MNGVMDEATPLVPTVTLAQWLQDMRLSWKQGEHIALIGPTGSGKTTLARSLLPIRDYVVVIAVKRHDDTLDSYPKQGYRVITKWPPEYTQRHVVFWTRPKTLGDLLKQREQVIAALESLYLAGGWCVYFDDLSYVCDQLRIKTPVVTFLNQGRSSGISAVSSCTRPRKVPLEAFNQTRHVVVFRFTDRVEVWRCAEIAGVSHHAMEVLMSSLRGNDFLAFSHGSVAIVRN